MNAMEAKPQYKIVSLTDHQFAAFLRSFGEWTHFSFCNVNFFQTKKDDVRLAMVGYNNDSLTREISVVAEFYNKALTFIK